MLIPRLSVPFCACLAAAALVAACGGDEEAAAAAPDETGQVLALSAANEPALSAAAVQEFSAAQAIAGRGAGSSPGQISIARRPVQQALLSVARAGRVRALAAEPFTEDCSGGGTLTIEVADDLLSSKTTFNACIEDGDTLNGTISLTAVSASDDGQQLLFDVTLDGLALTQGTVTDKLTGDLRMSVDASKAGQSSTTFSSVLQALEHSVNGQVQASHTLRDYQSTHITTEAGDLTDSFTLSSEGSLAALGTVAYKAETLTALGTPAGATEPTSGQAKITVNGKGIILLTVEATRVRVQGDVEGDGTFEIDRFDTWSNLSGGL